MEIQLLVDIIGNNPSYSVIYADVHSISTSHTSDNMIVYDNECGVTRYNSV